MNASRPGLMLVNTDTCIGVYEWYFISYLLFMLLLLLLPAAE